MQPVVHMYILDLLYSIVSICYDSVYCILAVSVGYVSVSDKAFLLYNVEKNCYFVAPCC